MRISRGIFWLIVLANLLIGTPFITALMRLGFSLTPGRIAFPVSLQLAIHGIVYLPAFWMGVWRLHDTGMPGWLVLFPLAVVVLMPYLLVTGFAALLAVAALVNGHPILFDAALFQPMPWLLYFPIAGMIVVPAVYTLYQWCLPGQKGPNRYGPVPRQLFCKS